MIKKTIFYLLGMLIIIYKIVLPQWNLICSHNSIEKVLIGVVFIHFTMLFLSYLLGYISEDVLLHQRGEGFCVDLRIVQHLIAIFEL